MKNKVKPTEKQKNTFQHMKKGMALRDAMLAGGYSEVSSQNPKQNFMDREGTKSLIQKYRDSLVKSGITPEVLVEIQAEGLFDQNSAIRLGYLKETKKDFGITVETPNTLVQVNNYKDSVKSIFDDELPTKD